MSTEKKFIELPVSELEIMQGIWLLHEEGEKNISAGLVMKRCPSLNRLKLTTVLTLIQRLIVKGFITSEKVGRANCYTPIIDAAEYRQYATMKYLHRMYADDKAYAITDICAANTEMSKADIRKVLSALENENILK